MHLLILRVSVYASPVWNSKALGRPQGELRLFNSCANRASGIASWAEEKKRSLRMMNCELMLHKNLKILVVKTSKVRFAYS